MKKTFAVIIACAMLAGCAAPVEETADSTSTTETTSAALTTAAASTTESTSTTENASTTDDEDAFTDTELCEMEAVQNAISELMQSDGFSALDTAQKAERMLTLLNELADNGTAEYAYPLIAKPSIYHDGGDMISFSYSCGVLGGIKLEPFDPMMN